jgi:hypothetical protein
MAEGLKVTVAVGWVQEAYIRARVLRLMDYLYRIQQK